LVLVDESDAHDFGLYRYEKPTKARRPSTGRGKPDSKEDKDDRDSDTGGIDPAELNPHLRDPEDLDREQESQGPGDDEG
jgi:hypothetical protein